MTDRFPLWVTKVFRDALERLVEKESEPTPLLDVEEDRSNDMPTTIVFVTKESYSTYIIRTYPIDEYDEKSGQKYAVMVDGDNPIQAERLKYEDPKISNQKQLISFPGDDVDSEVVFFMDNARSDAIDMRGSPIPITPDLVKDAIESMPSIGKGALKVTVWPGRGLIEFVKPKDGRKYPLLKAAHHPDAVFDIIIKDTHWNATGETVLVSYPIDMVGAHDFDDDNVNDAVAGGTFGKADWMVGKGYVVDVGECYNHNGNGFPDL